MTDKEMREEILALLADHGIHTAKRNEDKLIKVFMLGMEHGWCFQMDVDFGEDGYIDELEKYRKEGIL